MNRLLTRLKEQAREIKKETFTLYFAARHRETPWYAKFVAACVVGYALSPIDLIPDFIPILGLLDDLIIVPLGIALVIKLVPSDVLANAARRQRRESKAENRLTGLPPF